MNQSAFVSHFIAAVIGHLHLDRGRNSAKESDHPEKLESVVESDWVLQADKDDSSQKGSGQGQHVAN